MNTASLELCKELHELTHWNTDKEWPRVTDQDGNDAHGYVPNYSLGYLLRKLPTGTHIFRTSRGYGASIGYRDNKNFADTPEDACAKLAIELHKQGILTNQKESKEG